MRAKVKKKVIKHRETRLSIPSSNKNVLTVWRIGDNNYPATDEDIKDFTDKLKEAREKGTDIVTHNLVDFIQVIR